ncbi:hypothetical protein BC835DRAFT_521550 [Cytidiella melzeri]|nr:hypothetical protein BC835DRAFT_521550 [Cytidiella melzeri]
MWANMPDTLLSNTPSAAPFLNLHFDILVLLASHLGRSDLLSLMRVCRSLHSALVPHLLRSHPTIRLTKQLLSFCQFVMIDVPMRFIYLQRLSISISYVYSTQIAHTLRKVFQHATHLEELGILDCGFMEGNSGIPAAIAALTSIRTLVLRHPTHVALDMLAEMCSQPTRVEVSFSNNPRHRLDPIELLENCRTSLVTLCMSLPRFSEVRLGLQYTALTKLVLKCHRAILASPVIYHYPNVRQLTVTMCDGFCGHGGTNSKRVKRDNVEIEDTRSINSSTQTYSWSSLDLLRGHIPGIYSLALNCPVQRLELTEVATNEIGRFGHIMKDVRPSILEVQLNSVSFDLKSLSTLMQQAPKDLHSLTVDIVAAEVSGDLQTSMVSGA